MAQVTAVILTFSVMESDHVDDHDVLGKVNEFFLEMAGKGASISRVTGQINPALNAGFGFRQPQGDEWYGGTKYLEVPVYVGSFNYLGVPGFLKHLADMTWKEPANVQVLVQEENDSRFRVWDVVTLRQMES